jgi:hypothetical protein
MAADNLRGSVDVLRNVVRLAVEQDGLRSTARAVKLTATGLQRFVDGSAPRVTTLKKLRAWYLRRRPDPRSTEVAKLAASVLVDGIPPEKQADAVKEVMTLLDRLHRAAGVRPPEWIKRLPG